MEILPGTAPRPISRIQKNILASSERRLLTWLCSHLPQWVKPDHLTALGVAGAFAIFAGYAASLASTQWLWLSLAGYFIQWFGDSLDGSLARYRRIERPSYGYFLDHSCDGIATLLILAGIGFSPFVRVDIALLALAGYLLMSIHAYLSARVLGELKLSYLAAGPTEIRFVLIAMTLTMMALGPNRMVFPQFSGFDLFVGAVAALLIGLFVGQTLVTAKRLSLIDVKRS